MTVEAIYIDHYRQVYHQAHMLTRSREDAEDLAQDAFMLILRKLDSFRGDCALSSWIYRIVLNTWLMKRRRKIENDPLVDVPVRPVVPDFDLERAIDDLPDGQRQVVRLRLEGYQHDEIAQITGGTIGGSRSQLNHAVEKLRKRLVA